MYEDRELELWRELPRMEAWTVVCKEIDRRVKSCMEMLTRCDSKDLQGLQLEITLLGELKRMPEAVVSRESEGSDSQ